MCTHRLYSGLGATGSSFILLSTGWTGLSTVGEQTCPQAGTAAPLHPMLQGARWGTAVGVLSPGRVLVVMAMRAATRAAAVVCMPTGAKAMPLYLGPQWLRLCWTLVAASLDKKICKNFICHLTH